MDDIKLFMENSPVHCCLTLQTRAVHDSGNQRILLGCYACCVINMINVTRSPGEHLVDNLSAFPCLMNLILLSIMKPLYVLVIRGDVMK